tara:strand:- start:812 stop:1285 length:474 start_codon:yes stop_codon:yes gene_type:complete
MNVSELFNRNDVTDAEWQEAQEFIAAEQAKAWNEFLVRSQDFDDAFFSEPYKAEWGYVRNKGIGFMYSLADMEGNLVNAKCVSGQYGYVWRVEKEDASIDWVNVSSASTTAKQQKHYNSKGYQLVQCEVRVRQNQFGKIQLDLNETVNVTIMEDEDE